MVRPITYNNYDKIVDDVFFLGKNTILKMNVSLSNMSNNKRYFFHREVSYPSKYEEEEKNISIKRSYSYYLSIEKHDHNMNVFLIIRPQDMIYLRRILDAASTWFDNIYAIKDRKLYIYKKQDPLIINLVDNKYLQLDPVVIDYETTGTQMQGIRFTFGNPGIFLDINIETFYGFKYTIDSFNMFQSAQNMINYLGRPDYGYNLYEIKDQEYSDLSDEPDISITKYSNRKIPTNRNNKKSYFSK